MNFQGRGMQCHENMKKTPNSAWRIQKIDGSPTGKVTLEITSLKQRRRLLSGEGWQVLKQRRQHFLETGKQEKMEWRDKRKVSEQCQAIATTSCSDVQARLGKGDIKGKGSR